MSVLYHTLMHEAGDTLTYILLSIADITFCVGIRKWAKSATADAVSVEELAHPPMPSSSRLASSSSISQTFSVLFLSEK